MSLTSAPRQAVRLLALGLLAVTVLALLLLAGRAGVASLYYFPASFALQQWQNQQNADPTARPAQQQLEQALVQLTQAVALQPENPHYWLTLAKVNEWAWYSGVMDSRSVAQNEAIYQRAIALRPDWPLAYADFAYFRAAVQGRLSDSWLLLEQATAKGPYLPQVQQKWLSIAFSHWPQLSVAQKAQIWQRVELGVRGPLRAVTLQQIKTFSMQRQSCIFLSRRLAAEAFWPQLRPVLCR